jgi:hypothetical protein
MSRRRRNASDAVPADLATYDPVRWAAEALPDETVFYGSGPPSGADAYYRALLRAGVADDRARHYRAVFAVREIQAEIGWTGPLYPWPTITQAGL